MENLNELSGDVILRIFQANFQRCLRQESSGSPPLPLSNPRQPPPPSSSVHPINPINSQPKPNPSCTMAESLLNSLRKSLDTSKSSRPEHGLRQTLAWLISSLDYETVLGKRCESNRIFNCRLRLRSADRLRRLDFSWLDSSWLERWLVDSLLSDTRQLVQTITRINF